MSDDFDIVDFNEEEEFNSRQDVSEVKRSEEVVVEPIHNESQSAPVVQADENVVLSDSNNNNSCTSLKSDNHCAPENDNATIKETKLNPVEPSSSNLPPETPNSEVSSQEFDDLVNGRLKQHYEPIAVKDAVELLYVFNPLIINGSIKLHDWQKETLKFLCSDGIFTREFPLHYILAASNGSGKDSYVISPFAVWHCISKIRSRCIITSSSFNQLKNQTEPGIRSLAYMINRYLGGTILVMKQFHVVCKLTGSEILMFATDDPGLAEGYHPWPDYVNSEMALIMNESKTIKDDMFGALKRCNGYNRWIEVSSPGHKHGHMYSQYVNAKHHPEKYIPRKDIWYSRKVTSYDCQHISRAVIEDDKRSYGESSPLFRSMHLAEFTSIEDSPVISSDALEACCNREHVAHQTWNKGTKTAGIDLSGGAEKGDETCGYLLDGNKIVDTFSFVGITDTIEIKNRVLMHLESWKSLHGLKAEDVNVDDGNVGRSIIDMLHRDSWPVNRVINQSRPVNPKQFANRGAELYWNVRRLVEEHILVFDAIKDSVLLDQLRSRQYKQHATFATIVLEGKKEAKARGIVSPNKADAYVLACARYNIHDFIKEDSGKTKEEEKPRYSIKELRELSDNDRLNVVFPDNNKNDNRRIVNPQGSSCGYLRSFFRRNGSI